MVSSDGHSRTGEIPFTVIASSTPTATPSPGSTVAEASDADASASAAPVIQPTEPAAQPQAGETGSPARGGPSVFVWVAIGLAAIVAGVGIAAGRRRRPGR
ncbi:hypothetical protein J2S55_007115 [Streptosporangium brasiliense]|uniref:Gram-positive cocci surface proteins LPxTG domain-containing protein n=1 Tax=Streptosporangium brasiliense TaxID=47480 RepID=A0ABT9REZ0_9ACTN|nr:hypothetical protein [Streptosporangium brasiliense]